LGGHDGNGGRSFARGAAGPTSFSPWSTLWWFFVPFANLIKPYQAMEETLNLSTYAEQRQPEGALLYVWWGGYWLASVVGYVARLSGNAPFILLLVLQTASAAALFRIIALATQGQRNSLGLAATFA
jgi:hypothetical protein